MKIALIGYGKMGKTIAELAKNKHHEIILTVDADNKNDLQSDLFKSADVAIEFTQPNQAFNNIIACFDAGVPVVSGTTGWYDELPGLIAACNDKNGALIYASNFSIGVNLFFVLNKILAKQMSQYPDYKVSMLETHHTAKLDAPSGTAITLAEDLINCHNGYQSWNKGTSSDNTSFPILSVREDPAPGKHEIFYTSEIDEIKISHEALNRNGFSLGALYAANWIKGKKGVHHFADILSLQLS
jgi:4-hydroxy-tetrahydrodipicolinate reductase